MNKLLEIQNLTKTFGSVTANDKVSLDVFKGEIHCLLGENGAGKSCLSECIYGYYTPDSGHILFDGHELEYGSPSSAIALGIGMVHQHFVLVEPLSVIENIIVGTPEAPTFLNLKKAEQKIQALCDKFDIHINLYDAVQNLSVGEQQLVEILKVLYLDTKLLILDEPTAVLTPQESAKLFESIKKMVTEGISVILISHKFEEVMQSDRVTVMRKGRVVSTVVTEESNEAELAKMMMGKELVCAPLNKSKPGNQPVLEVTQIRLRQDKGDYLLKDLSFQLHKGEILGIAGVAGNGQKELFEVLTGIRKPDSGEMYLERCEITNFSPKKIMAMGIGHIPQDRYQEGLVGDFTISENLILGCQEQATYSTGPFLNQQAIQQFAHECSEDFDIAAPSIETPVKLLSGGNAQKVILAREMSQSSKVLLANHPTRGLDIGVIDYVNKQLLQMRENGYGILLATDELNDLFELSDRIAVIHKGQFVAILKPEEASIEQVGLLMAGATININEPCRQESYAYQA